MELSTYDNLPVRLLSGLILAPFVVLFSYIDERLFFVFATIVSTICIYEWCSITYPSSARFVVLGLLTIVLMLGCYFIIQPWIGLLFLGLLGIAFILIHLFTQTHSFAKICWIAYGFVYVNSGFLAVLWLRQIHCGFFYVGFLFLIVWTMDSASFFFGRLLRGPLLAPNLSPHKTWSGYVGGVCARFWLQ